MNVHSIDNPVLVAPRPVRLTTAPGIYFHRPPSRGIPLRGFVSAPANAAALASDQLERMRIGDENGSEDPRVGLLSPVDAGSDKDSVSPRASPRASLPSEALEEFLSILRPSLFPPSSPILRTRRQLTTFPYERPGPYGYKRALIHQKADSVGAVEELSSDRAPSRNTASDSPESLASEKDELEELPIRWFTSAALASPVSRSHTRNPFQRHPSYDIAFTTNSASANLPLSPAAIPLPLPTPDEMIEMSA